MIHGDSQSLILGMLWFLLHANDFKIFFKKVDAIMFADDTTILDTSKSQLVLFVLINEELINAVNVDNCLIADN